MTTNIDRAAEIIGQHVKCGWSICERRRRSEDGKLPPLDACGNTNPSCRDVAEGIAQALADADPITPYLPAPSHSESDGFALWKLDHIDISADTERGKVYVDGNEITPVEAREEAAALLAAADHAEEVGRADK